ncbi:MAG: sodium-dependent bicarbonate transport family permease [Reyranella sp.]|nr:sodium-dependent bicarbonate transport family permease [Reyranella sp.]
MHGDDLESGAAGFGFGQIASALSLGVTFPFNPMVGIPLYIALAQMLSR